MKVFKVLYNHLKSCIVVDGRLIDYFLNDICLMQGEVLCQTLFNLYVNDIEFGLDIEFKFAMYALWDVLIELIFTYDDMALVPESESVEGLQVLSNELVSELVISGNSLLILISQKLISFRNSGKIKVTKNGILETKF